jgi:colicin import membrane protein
MRNGDFPESGPADRLGRMLLISMVFHVAVFGALVWYNSKTPRVKPLLPTYTVDLVNMPLPAPAPGPKTLVPQEAPPPGLAAKPGVEVREKPGSPVRSAPEPKKVEGGKPRPVEKIPVPQEKPAVPPPPAPAKPAPVQPQIPPKVAAPPPKVAAKPAPAAPKHVEPPTPAPAIKPAVTPQKPAKTIAETKAPAEKAVKPTPEAAAPPAKVTDAKAREQQIAKEINAAQQKAAEASRNQQIQESVRGLEKGLAAKSRNQAYQEAVGQAASRLSAGKVITKVSRDSGGGGGGAGGGGMGTAQTAAYGAQVSQTVRRHWQPNCLQRSTMHHLKAVIIVRIQSDGSISASWFEKESGDRLFDQSAMTAVTRSSPLPPLPAGQEKVEIGITFTPEWKASS